jgi:hypothetical protein
MLSLVLFSRSAVAAVALLTTFALVVPRMA